MLDFPDAPTLGDIFETVDGPVYEWMGDAWDRVTGPPKTAATLNTVGDVKSSFLTVDHEGWILLDGRLVSTLTSTQQNRASSLGFAANLPDANGSVAMQDGGAPGAISGSMGKTIAVANLPAHNMTSANSAVLTSSGYDAAAVTSSSAGNHTHQVEIADAVSTQFQNWDGANADNGIAAFDTGGWSNGGATPNYGARNIAKNAGAHTHTIDLPNHTHTIPAHAHTVALGGGGQALDVTPKRMSVNLFCFLGA